MIFILYQKGGSNFFLCGAWLFFLNRKNLADPPQFQGSTLGRKKKSSGRLSLFKSLFAVASLIFDFSIPLLIFFVDTVSLCSSIAFDSILFYAIDLQPPLQIHLFTKSSMS